ncbi:MULTISPECIES: STAS/SEC14 domain-containing protein [Noviherbaspirillum]|uniref:STAS/SEC14 domain-containing protein n=1 Tax=Noviherbaspirillum TaxID=1344552 RepID=UPI00124CEE58|nr:MULTISPECIES: STAS/SEC14 domain-containing protein [Noviherbaspirillum]
MNHQQLWVEPVGGIITARIRGKCTEEILRECQDRVVELVKDTQQVKVLYDALEMEDPGVQLAILQQNMDSDAWKKYGPIPLRRAILVPNTRIAFLARLAFGQFGEGTYRVFYNDLTQAVVWLEERN